MKKQSGFTLVEIAIVLVIIGLLLGGVLKGQELINSAKVKNFANDFRNIPLFIYGYQDKFKAIPGDDKNADINVGPGTPKGNGDGVINGQWNANTVTESVMFWQHVRGANLAAGATSLSGVASGAAVPDLFMPTNAEGGTIGIQGLSAANTIPIQGLRGTYAICSKNILGKFVKQLDLTVDNGDTATGAMLAGTVAAVDAGNAAPTPTASIDEATTYTVCLGF